MIFDVIFLIISAFIYSIWAVFSLVTLPIPTYVVTAIQQYFSYVGVLSGILPLYPRTDMTGLVHDVGILTIIGFVIQIIVAKYAIRLVVWIAGYLPFLKINARHAVN